ncbi:MAG TPA: methyltransferase, partial [Flavisolibacter sp.]|nr:methyltransferase [Flavisolibacter sp.]
GAWCAEEISKTASTQLLDIGTGTGLLSLMIAQKNSLKIDAIEIDEEAAQQASENMALSPWKENSKVIHEDIAAFKAGKKYDCIVSNPPFYENELSSPQERKNLAHHSSQLSIAQLLNLIKDLLAGEGVFFLLLPFKRIKEAEELIGQRQFFIHKKVVVHPSVSHPPFRIMFMCSPKNKKTSSSQIFIRDESQHYTPAFVTLLKDYYLYL